MKLLSTIIFCTLLTFPSTDITSNNNPSPLLSSSAYFELIKSLGRGSITSADWQTDSSMLAVGGSSGVDIYNAELELTSHIDVPQVSYVSWSSRGEYLAISTARNETRIWDTTQQETTRIFSNSQKAVWHPKDPLAAIFSSVSSTSSVDVYNANTDEQGQTFRADAFSNFDWSPDGTRLAITNRAGEVQVYSWSTGEQLYTVEAQEQPILVTFSPDNSTLVTALTYGRSATSPTNVLKIWNSSTGELQRVLRVGFVDALAWNSDGTKLAIGEYQDGKHVVTVFEISTGALLYELGSHLGVVHSLEWLSDNRVMSAGADNTLQVWDLSTSPPALLSSLQEYSGSIASLDWEPNGRRLVSAGTDGLIRLWNTDTDAVEQIFQGGGGEIHSVDWSPDGQCIASGGEDNHVRRWDVSRPYEGISINTHTYSVIPGEGNPSGVAVVSWSPQGDKIASGGYDGMVRIRLGAIDQRLLPGEGWPATSIAWSPQGDHIASTNGSLYIWDIATGNIIRTLTCEGDRVLQVAWNSDGQYIAGASENQLCLWDSVSGERITILDITRVDALAWQPDGPIIATITLDVVTGSRSLQLVDPFTNDVFVTEGRATGAIAWSTDGTKLAVGSADGVVEIWQYRQ
jgi:eukaryotic-like serine/threonine-protein kinase